MTSREKVQALIRAEIDRQRPVEVARRTLELLAESSVRAIDAAPGYRIVGRDGAPRMRRGEGAEVPLTLADLFDELRRQHPSLFLAGPAAPPPMAVAAPPPAEAAPVASPLPEMPRMPAAVSRDWIRLIPEEGEAGPAPSAPSAEPAPAPTPAPTPASGPASPRPAPFWRRGAARLGNWVAARARARAERRGAARLPAPAPPAPAGEGLKPAVARPTMQVRRRRGRGPLYAALGLLLAAGAGAWLYSGGDSAPSPPAGGAPSSNAARRTTTEAKIAANARREPGETGTLVPGEGAAPKPTSSLAGVAEVVDTATLRLGGRTLRLFGVETAKGAQPEDLATYLAGRPVACQASAGGASYLCSVDGHDLSEVVLYNGGGRATAEATSDLLEAERHARTEKLGIWRK
ncbi:thermonuclease family protein [Methylobacterium sp. WSM2598]|uniref:thermonuclease family protein n=1 Tax=Methylobacterium sp. WSM2598 TaxID=398261 RepID=UPI000375F8D9|nr:hypothetical protein [Methylobacterium sp. WSM2598]